MRLQQLEQQQQQERLREQEQERIRQQEQTRQRELEEQRQREQELERQRQQQAHPQPVSRTGDTPKAATPHNSTPPNVPSPNGTPHSVTAQKVTPYHAPEQRPYTARDKRPYIDPQPLKRPSNNTSRPLSRPNLGAKHPSTVVARPTVITAALRRAMTSNTCPGGVHIRPDYFAAHYGYAHGFHSGDCGFKLFGGEWYFNFDGGWFGIIGPMPGNWGF
jgi:hypothetical protein